MILNNLKVIEQHTNSIICKLRDLTQCIEKNDNYEFILDKKVTDTLFNTYKIGDDLPKIVEIIVNGKAIQLTKRELEVLKTLKYSISNQSIANELCISTSTVEKHLYNLRSKLSIFTKEGLRQFSSSSPSINIYDRL